MQIVAVAAAFTDLVFDGGILRFLAGGAMSRVARVLAFALSRP